jgi:hypothetical protein
MSYSTGFLVSLAILGGALSGAAQDAPAPQLNGRELYYNTSSAQAKPAAAPSAKPAAQSKPRPKAVAKHDSTLKPAAAPTTPPSAPVDAGGGMHVTPAAFVEPTPSSPAAPALGLKYTILKWVDDQRVEVSPKTVFHAGDRVQFSVEPNGPGYLYIVKQGSSGMWKPVFPSPEIADGDNRVEGWRSYVMPPHVRLVFDEETGTEKIFIVLSRVEEPNLERLMFSLKGAAHPASAPQDKPALEGKPKTLIAGLTIENSAIGHLREAYGRDLIIERVGDEDTPGPQKEKAVYVVNPTGSSDSRVVADIGLVHR